MLVSLRYPFRGGGGVTFDSHPCTDMTDLTYPENKMLSNWRAEAVDRHCVTPVFGQGDVVKCRRSIRHLQTL